MRQLDFQVFKEITKRFKIHNSDKFRAFLSMSFPIIERVLQNDTTEAYQFFLKFIPGTEDHCCMNIIRTKICKECVDTITSEIKEEWYIPLNRKGKSPIQFKDAILEWSIEPTTLVYQCDCKLKRRVYKNPELYHTAHAETFVIKNIPKMLYIKTENNSSIT